MNTQIIYISNVPDLHPYLFDTNNSYFSGESFNKLRYLLIIGDDNIEITKPNIIKNIKNYNDFVVHYILEYFETEWVTHTLSLSRRQRNGLTV